MRHGFDWDGFFGFGPRVFAFGHGGRHRRRRQWFESGDMKYVILKQLREKPKHGYEIMKDLAEQMHGCYSPSPGTVYPTLQWLEDEGLVRSRDVDGKKVYEITEAGTQFLEEHKDVVTDIFDRVADAVEDALGGSMAELNQGVARLMKTVYRRGYRGSDEVRKKITDILARAAKDIEDALV
ncbi:MAG TPA: PadR family transcriptional regulator [Gemmatimonadales bacterium]|nr:PadR family transcriptional regulator [Gemmatimonadales bacterium]